MFSVYFFWFIQVYLVILLTRLSKMYNMYQRALFQTIKDRAIEPRRFIQVLAGPRQVGKTTLVTQVMQHLPFPAHYATADCCRKYNHTLSLSRFT